MLLVGHGDLKSFWTRRIAGCAGYYAASVDPYRHRQRRPVGTFEGDFANAAHSYAGKGVLRDVW